MHLAGLGVAAAEESKVEQRIKLIPVNQRRRVVRPRPPIVPSDVFVFRFTGLQRDVALRAGADGVDVFLAIPHVTGGDVQQAVRLERRRDDDRRARLPLEAPAFAAFQVVGTCAVAAGQDQLPDAVVLPHIGRGPVAGFVAFCFPKLPAGTLVVRRHPTVLHVVVDDDQLVAVEDGRSAGAPAVAHLVRLEHFFPEHFSGLVEAVEAVAAEVGVDPFAICHRRLGGVAVFDMDRRQGTRCQHFLLPKVLPALEVQAEHEKVVHVLDRLLAIATEIKAGFARLDFPIAHGGG